MPYITEYSDAIKVVLGEAAKYFALLLFAVLAIRFWRAAKNAPAACWANEFLMSRWPGERLVESASTGLAAPPTPALPLVSD